MIPVETEINIAERKAYAKGLIRLVKSVPPARLKGRKIHLEEHTLGSYIILSSDYESSHPGYRICEEAHVGVDGYLSYRENSLRFINTDQAAARISAIAREIGAFPVNRLVTIPSRGISAPICPN